jgi:hypothetical protein
MSGSPLAQYTGANTNSVTLSKNLLKLVPVFGRFPCWFVY